MTLDPAGQRFGVEALTIVHCGPDTLPHTGGGVTGGGVGVGPTAPQVIAWEPLVHVHVAVTRFDQPLSGGAVAPLVAAPTAQRSVYGATATKSGFAGLTGYGAVVPRLPHTGGGVTGVVTS